MDTNNENVKQIPVIIRSVGKACDVVIPDFNITVHGKDFIEAFATAASTVAAIYYYNLDRNVEIQLNTTYAEVERKCSAKNEFPTFLPLNP